MGYLDGIFYVINARDDKATSAQFVDWFYDINSQVPQGVQVYNYIENNTLQDPFYQQVFLPLFAERGQKDGFLNISPDTRKKPEKFTRIEGNLEPLNRTGRLVFNVDRKDDPHMARLAEEFILLTEQLKAPADGADCTEGAYFILNGKIRTHEINSVSLGRRPRNRKRV